MLGHVKSGGFTLVELAVVLAIIAMMLGGLVVTLSAQVDHQRSSETRTTLENIREALIGFAAANGRLPCPASATSNGQESFCQTSFGTCNVTPTVQPHGRCSNFYNGFVPSSALGITPSDSQGYAVDGWGNRIRYAVSDRIISPGTNITFTSIDGMKTSTMASIETQASSPQPGLLFVCSSSNGIGGTNCGSAPGTITITRKTPAVFFSTGRNGATGAAGADETANLNGDIVFVTHPPTAGGPGGEFDDVVTWVSLPVLFNRLITAGRLP